MDILQPNDNINTANFRDIMIDKFVIVEKTLKAD